MLVGGLELVMDLFDSLQVMLQVVPQAITYYKSNSLIS